MKILLAAATQFEIAPFLLSGIHKKIDVLITGAGIAAATYQLTKHLHHHHYDLVLQAGIAGTYTAEYAPGSVVLISKDAFAEIGSFENGNIKTLTDLKLSHELDWLYNNHAFIKQSELPKAFGVTVTAITDDVKRIEAIKTRWQPDVESMEGAALHYVCTHLQKPFLQLRSISNFVGDRDKTNWKTEEAIANLNAVLLQLIASL